MKYTIEGFSQEYALTLRKNVIQGKKEKLIKIDCIDLVILRWFVDFYPSMKKDIIDGREYAWLSHNYIAQELPLLDIDKRSFIQRLQKFVTFEILDYKFIKKGGSFSYYAFGKNYHKLITDNNNQSNDNKGMQSNDKGYTSECIPPTHSNVYPVDIQMYTKDSSINNPSIKNKSININIYKDVIDYLNLKTNKKFTATSDATQRFIHARISEGFKLDDFKTVIDKKCIDWVGTEWEKYLRPQTLFGTKFESYLNEPVKENKQVNKSSNNPFLDMAKERGLV